MRRSIMKAALELSRRVEGNPERLAEKANLIDNRPWGLATPEASEVLAELNRWSIGWGCAEALMSRRIPLPRE
jgi:hypothetical protein